MNTVELYEKYGITPAHYDKNESHFEFTQRIIGASHATVEYSGVTYSSSSNNKGSKTNNNSLYSY